MNWRAARDAVQLALLFVIVYGTTNWLTSLRPDIPSFYLSWERNIPFVPLMIIPYMSIDLFFIAVPFVCRTDQERLVVSRRITACILIAGACFLLFPLRFAFERPPAEGWLGTIFDSFRELDKPFNQFPSLHIALRAILANTYARHSKGILRQLLNVWFSLIGISTVLTYQHHLIDILGGFILAAVCFHLFREKDRSERSVQFNRIGFYYASGAGILVAIALITHPYGLLLLWPAASALVVAAAYFGFMPLVFQKRAGRLSWQSTFLFWPILLGHYWSLRRYARECDPWNAMTDRVWIGRKLAAAEANRAIAGGVVAVVDLTSEFSETRPFLQLPYLNLPVMDLTAPTREQLVEAVKFIAKYSPSGIVYVHCKIGYSRTAAVAAAYLLRTYHSHSIEDALTHLRSTRPSIVIREEVIEALRVYNEFLHAEPRQDRSTNPHPNPAISS